MEPPSAHEMSVETEVSHFADRVDMVVRCSCGWRRETVLSPRELDAVRSAGGRRPTYEVAAPVMIEHLQQEARAASHWQAHAKRLQMQLEHGGDGVQRALTELTAALGAEKAPSKRLTSAVRAVLSELGS